MMGIFCPLKGLAKTKNDPFVSSDECIMNGLILKKVRQNIHVALHMITEYVEYLVESDTIRCIISNYWIYGDIF